ncbi:MAG: hypothetical protein L0H53_15235 [Candidatus Nitrosocosmicus sp.]|nr:hypothetical protein [Candidatus Nitrosocosmicus sp.]
MMDNTLSVRNLLKMGSMIGMLLLLILYHDNIGNVNAQNDSIVLNLDLVETHNNTSDGHFKEYNITRVYTDYIPFQNMQLDRNELNYLTASEHIIEGAFTIKITDLVNPNLQTVKNFKLYLIIDFVFLLEDGTTSWAKDYSPVPSSIGQLDLKEAGLEQYSNNTGKLTHRYY